MALRMKHMKAWLHGYKEYRKKIPDVAPENRLTDEELNREIEDCEGVLSSLASKWHRVFPRIDAEDLYQEGVLGCYDARRLFDKSRGLKFNTYSRHWADQRIRRFVSRELKEWGHNIEFLGQLANRPAELPAALPDEFWERAEKLLVGRQYEVLSLRYREGLPQSLASERMGVGKSRVGQIEEKALERLTRCPELVRMLDDAN